MARRQSGPAAEPDARCPAAPALGLSVVMPAYNEADSIAAAIDDVVRHVFTEVPRAELLIVDDGSRDDTRERAEACAAGEPRLRVIHQANAGHGPALVAGALAARGEYCLLLDSDRQIGLQHFAETWRLVRGHDAVLGVRRQRADPRHRLLLSAALRRGMALVLGVRSLDPNVPYKLVRRELLQEAIGAMPERPHIPSLLLTVFLLRRGARVVLQDVPHRARAAGETTLKLRRLAVFCARALGELLRFHRRLGRRP